MGNSADKLYLDKIYDTVKEIKNETGTTIPGTLADLVDASTEVSGKVDQAISNLSDVDLDISSIKSSFLNLSSIFNDSSVVNDFTYIVDHTTESSYKTAVDVTGSGYLYAVILNANGGTSLNGNSDMEVTIDNKTFEFNSYYYQGQNNICSGMAYKSFIYSADNYIRTFLNESYTGRESLKLFTSSLSAGDKYRDLYMSVFPIKFNSKLTIKHKGKSYCYIVYVVSN